MFIRRDRPVVRRYTAVRVSLFFFAAGLWLAGVMIGSDLVTAIALGVAIVTFLFGTYLRRQASSEPEEEPELEEPQGGEGGW